MPTELAWPIISLFFACWAIWERAAAWAEARDARDRESELMERLHRKERQRLVAERKPVELEPVHPPIMDVGPPPNGAPQGDHVDDFQMPTMDDENEAMIEQMRNQGLAPEDILRRLSRRK